MYMKGVSEIKKDKSVCILCCVFTPLVSMRMYVCYECQLFRDRIDMFTFNTFIPLNSLLAIATEYYIKPNISKQHFRLINY